PAAAGQRTPGHQTGFGPLVGPDQPLHPRLDVEVAADLPRREVEPVGPIPDVPAIGRHVDGARRARETIITRSGVVTVHAEDPRRADAQRCETLHDAIGYAGAR